ncbi:MAG: hypothetical protein HYV07_02500 [Deltaproteobacteria bacterium]|nr:hypothetical protein [Deltaproteobacteria bacterium]
MAITLSGCSVERLELVLPSAFLNGAGSILVAIENDDLLLQVGVVSPNASPKDLAAVLPEISEYDQEPVTVTVARTTRRLDQLGLEPGLLDPKGVEAAETRPVLSFFREPPYTGELNLQAARVTSGAPSAFAAAEPSHKLANLVVARPSLCLPINFHVSNGAGPPNVSIYSLAFDDTGVALYGGTLFVRNATDDGWDRHAVTGRIVRDDDGTLEVDPPLDHFVEEPEIAPEGPWSMVFSEGRFVAWDGSGQFMELDRSGRMTGRIRTSIDEGDYQLSVGRDGTLFAVARHAGRVFEITKGATVAKAVTDLEFPENVRAISVFDRDRILVFTGRFHEIAPGRLSGNSFDDGELVIWDGARWTRHPTQTGETVFPAVLADEAGFVALLNADVYLFEHGQFTVFTGAALETSTVPKNGVAPLGAERYFVAGDVGLAKIYNPREGWCDATVGSHRNLEALAFDPANPKRSIGFDQADTRQIPGICRLETHTCKEDGLECRSNEDCSGTDFVIGAPSSISYFELVE